MAHDPDSAHAEAEDAERERARDERTTNERGFGARLGAVVKEIVVVLAMALVAVLVPSFWLFRASRSAV